MWYLGAIWLLLLLRCSVCGANVFNSDAAVATGNIYYQRAVSGGAPSELLLERVNELISKESVQLTVHGFTGSRTHVSIVPLANAYLAQGYANVLVADWADAARLDYASARKAVAKVAQHLARILNVFLIKHEISPAAVHVIGHSLGAHIAGGIGAYFNGTLGRVTGLDPALPLFAPNSADSLHAAAAQFVDVIHTDHPVFGDATPRGAADFYPHFGQAAQPGCDDFDLLTASKLLLEKYSCSHNRAVLLYAESIGMPKNFPARRCPFGDIKARNAAACAVAADGDRVAYMGEAADSSATGAYYLETYATPPYGQGLNARF